MVGGLGESTCPDRVKPETITEALNLRGAFSIQVGSQGTRVASSVMASGNALAAGSAGDTHTFRISAGSFEREITAAWDDVASVWDLSDGTTTTSSAGADLTMAELQAFLSTSLGGDIGTTLNGAGTQITLTSTLNHLVSITDVKGGLASALGLANDAPVITIDVVEEDTLETIKNKINAMYREENGLTKPEEWLHASIKLDAVTNTYYLSLESNVAGESSRINILGDENGSLQIAKRLGFLNDDGSSNYLEYARDAAFTFDGRLYLSESNTVRNARQVPILNDYSAKTVSEVSPGIRLELRAVGEADITVRHHIKGGALRGALEGRDDIILGFLGALDELAYGLASEMNALHYAGHGIGENISTTGYAFFDPILVQSGASRMLGLSRAIQEDRSLIAAAEGNGHGFSNGSGDGSNALRIFTQAVDPLTRHSFNGNAARTGYAQQFGDAAFVFHP